VVALPVWATGPAWAQDPAPRGTATVEAASGSCALDLRLDGWSTGTHTAQVTVTWLADPQPGAGPADGGRGEDRVVALEEDGRLEFRGTPDGPDAEHRLDLDLPEVAAGDDAAASSDGPARVRVEVVVDGEPVADEQVDLPGCRSEPSPDPSATPDPSGAEETAGPGTTPTPGPGDADGPARSDGPPAPPTVPAGTPASPAPQLGAQDGEPSSAGPTPALPPQPSVPVVRDRPGRDEAVPAEAARTGGVLRDRALPSWPRQVASGMGMVPTGPSAVQPLSSVPAQPLSASSGAASWAAPASGSADSGLPALSALSAAPQPELGTVPAPVPDPLVADVPATDDLLLALEPPPVLAQARPAGALLPGSSSSPAAPAGLGALVFVATMTLLRRRPTG
jgi:hypothetical protein